ncbi:DUF5067 domain-containing protein [Peptostreptococcaceae bacterium OttesenSCG-928-C18]|nr:DUF5067 domain-containing protein [Peptostreptococcaceae bacterium OttesenSCG-928-C18]
MRKKLLILGLIMMMVLTACDGNGNDETEVPTEATEEKVEPLTEEEEEILKSEEEYWNEEKRKEYVVDRENRIINLVIKTYAYKIEDTDAKTASKRLYEAGCKGFTVKLFFEDDKSNLLCVVKDGEVLENNMEEYIKKHPDKFRAMGGDKNNTSNGEKKSNGYKTDEYVYEFTGFDALPPNPSYGYDKSVIAISMKFTNNSTETIDAWYAFTTDVAVQQKGEELEGGMVPEDYKPTERANYDKEIKPGASIEVVFAYELLDTSSTVKIIDRWTEGNKYVKEVKFK